MTRNRIFAIGCLGSIVVAVALVAIIYFSQRGPYELARSRWTEKGSGDYTLVVSEACFCPYFGEVKLIVQSGRVIAVEPTDPENAPNLQGVPISTFDRMTVASMLDTARSAQPDAWTAPWLHQLSLGYDPTYGYVTGYHSDLNGRLTNLLGQFVYDASYSYTAHDLVITAP